MVLPKTDFAAIEIKPGETAHQAVGALMRLSTVLFSKLEVFDTFKIHKTAFVRFRTDLEVGKLRASLLQDGRAVILLNRETAQYEVILPDGSQGKHSLSAMHATPRVTEHRTYRGTRDKFWTRQF